MLWVKNFSSYFFSMGKFIFIILNLALMGWAQNSSSFFARGADVGWLSEMEASGRKFYTADGVEKDLLDILPDYCINSIRLRVWVDPANGWSGQDDVVALAKRAYQKGYRLMIDFHYSDNWADPGKQYKPKAWENYSVPQLEQAVYDHTHQVLSAIKAEGIFPHWVQIGNETNDGMLWPDGRVSTNGDNFSNYAKFVKSGHLAAKAVFPQTLTIVHVANGFDNGLFKWNIGGLLINGAEFDVIAMSLYPDKVSDWPSIAQQARSNMDDLVQRYKKPIMVSEIGLSVSYPQDAQEYIAKVIELTQGVANNQGLGVFWWEPQAYNWRGYDKVAWSNNGRPTIAMDGFKTPGCPALVPPGDNPDLPDISLPPDPDGPALPSTVAVEFRVKMPENTQQAFITGTMTGAEGSWEIIAMEALGQGEFTKTFDLMGQSTGAYYYLNANNWDAREVVPAECVEWYESDRGYKVSKAEGGDAKQQIADFWNACGEAPTAIIPRFYQKSDDAIQGIKLDLLGRKVQ